MKNQGFSEKDWQLFRAKLPEWQESYMNELNRKYIMLLSDNRAPSEKFWDLVRQVNEDKNRAGVQLSMRRSAMLDNIISLINDGAIALEDLDNFSDELKETLRFAIDNAEDKYEA